MRTRISELWQQHPNPPCLATATGAKILVLGKAGHDEIVWSALFVCGLCWGQTAMNVSLRRSTSRGRRTLAFIRIAGSDFSL